MEQDGDNPGDHEDNYRCRPGPAGKRVLGVDGQHRTCRRGKGSGGGEDGRPAWPNTRHAEQWHPVPSVSSREPHRANSCHARAEQDQQDPNRDHHPSMSDPNGPRTYSADTSVSQAALGPDGARFCCVPCLLSPGRPRPIPARPPEGSCPDNVSHEDRARPPGIDGLVRFAHLVCSIQLSTHGVSVLGEGHQ